MKKLICTALAAVMLLSACGSRESSGGEGVTATVASVSDISSYTSMDIAKDMRVGWNLGNTLDVCAADRDGDGRVNEAPAEGEKVDEMLWGNVMTAPELFAKLREDGINAVRIPVTWRDHLGSAPDYAIDSEWLERVHEVVDYALKQDMYVIINVHHDGGGDPAFGAWIRNASWDYDNVEEKYTALWKQICASFADYPEQLIYESMNEVGFDDLPENEAYELLNRLNQLFVDTVRSSSGNDPKRHLLIAGYWTDTDKTCSDKFRMPDDPAGRCMVSVHYYTPWEFCTTNIQQSWGDSRETARMKRDVNKLKTTFVDKGIPVIIGEYGTGTGNDAASRVYFAELLTKLCRSAGIPCFYWDNGEEFDRVNYTWTTPGLIDALTHAASGEDYDVTK